jgi:hypothetical protein
MLRYLKATTLGLVVGVITGVVATEVYLQLQVWWQMRHMPGGGAGGVGAAGVSLGWTLLAAIIGFLLGFLGVLRRS